MTSFLGSVLSSLTGHHKPRCKFSPKIFIIAMFSKEASGWFSETSMVKFERTVKLPGLSRGYSTIHMTAKEDVAILVAGTGLINAALSLQCLTSSEYFDLAKTYFLITGIGGINPGKGSIGDVVLAKFAIQTDLQLEWDAREIPGDWPTGYVPMGASGMGSYAKIIYGSEVFELNGKLRDIAFSCAENATLTDSSEAAQNRALYRFNPHYGPATESPCVRKGDVTASNTFFHGTLLGKAASRAVTLYSDGGADYYVTAQEDTAILAALLRAALLRRVDFSRIILMRSGSNFDRPQSDLIVPSIPFVLDHGGFDPACANLYLAGNQIVQHILSHWRETFEAGIVSENYVGDIYGSLGGKPDFGPYK